MISGRRIAVASDNRLLCDSTVAAVRTFRYDAVPVLWPHRGALEQHVVNRLHASGITGGVMFGDFQLHYREADAIALVTTSPIRWVLCVADPTEDHWADFIRAGVSAVVPTATTLRGLVNTLERVLATHPSAHPAKQDRSIAEWNQVLEDRNAVLARFASLTPREVLVLDRIYDGISTRDIAGADGVSLATVRTQIKAILRKLDVHTQLAAVCEYRKIQHARGVEPRRRNGV